MINKLFYLSLFAVTLFAQPQESESYNKLRAKHLSKSDGLLSKNNNYVEIKSSEDLKQFIKDGCVNVGLDTANSGRGRKINYVSIENVKFDAASICDDFDGVNFGIISDETINARLSNYVKIKNTTISNGVNAGIIIKSRKNTISNAQLINNVDIKNAELGRTDFRKQRKQISHKERRLEKHYKKHIIKENGEEDEKW